MIFRFLERALGPSGDAEDLTHEVFVCLFSKVRGLRDRNALRSFLFSIAIRVLKRELRRRRVRRLFNVSGIEQFPEQSVMEFDVEARQALRKLYAILDRLSDQERSAFVLRHVEGMSLDEVSSALGVSLATAKRRLQRASQTVSHAADMEPSLGSYSPGGPR
jgi:RNA polymerase sigma-70 factor (ECF subfamily)